jgi:hypothetical protein
VPRSVQSFVIRFNEKFGYIEPEDSFRKTTKYVSRLRKFGVLLVGSSVLLFLVALWVEELAVYIVEEFVIENAL